MILLTCIDHESRRTYIDFGVKGQGHIWTLIFLPFLHNNSISFWHTMTILHTCIDHDPRRTSINFGVKRLKIKVISGLWTFYHFRITSFPFGIQWWYFTHVLTMTWEGPLLILGSKGQKRLRLNLESLNLLMLGVFVPLGQVSLDFVDTRGIMFQKHMYSIFRTILCLCWWILSNQNQPHPQNPNQCYSRPCIYDIDSRYSPMEFG